MLESVLYSPFFGLALTAGCWWLGLTLREKTRWVLCNPLLVAGALLVIVLAVFQIPFDAYRVGGNLVQTMLGPVTAVLALNIYRQRTVLQRYFVPVLAGTLAGSLASLGFVWLLCSLFQVDELMLASLLPKSVTTAIAIGIAESRGGVGGIAAAAVLITGLTGAVFAPHFARLFHITDPVAEGLAIGASSHALGTTKAMEIGEVQGAVSSIALCVCGILTSVLTLFF